jgi:PAS domain S-box-containing protein
LTSLAETLEDRRTNLARLQSLVNASPVAMYACRAEGDFTTTFVTEGVRTLWGYEPSDFLRDPRFWTEHLHPEDAPRVLRQLTNVVEQGRHSYDYRFRVKSGEYRWTHDDMRLVRDRAGNPVEIAGYCFDITEQKLAEAALRESEERQKIIFNSTSDLQGLFRMEPGNVFVTEAMNRAMAENLRSRMGKNAADFLGKDFSELLAATGMSTEEIESRRSLYRQAAEERTTVRWDSPPSALRDPRGLRLSGDGPAGKLHPHPVEWAQRLQALQG